MSVLYSSDRPPHLDPMRTASSLSAPIPIDDLYSHNYGSPEPLIFVATGPVPPLSRPPRSHLPIEQNVVYTKNQDSAMPDKELLDEDQMSICTPLVRGYCLTTKEWG